MLKISQCRSEWKAISFALVYIGMLEESSSKFQCSQLLIQLPSRIAAGTRLQQHYIHNHDCFNLDANAGDTRLSRSSGSPQIMLCMSQYLGLPTLHEKKFRLHCQLCDVMVMSGYYWDTVYLTLPTHLQIRTTALVSLRYHVLYLFSSDQGTAQFMVYSQTE